MPTNPFPYEDIIHLPHHQSSTRPHIPVSERAAQFSPFAALSGHGAAIREAERQVEERIELEEDSVTRLNEKLQFLLRHLPEHPIVSITYFVPDEKKSGGTYVTTAGAVWKIDMRAQSVFLENGTKIPMGDILSIEGASFSEENLF